MNKITSIDSLGTNGYVYRAYPRDISMAVAGAMQAWKRFCDLPEKSRTSFGYHPNGGMGVGYELKKQAGAFRDLKEDFHFTSGMREWLAQVAEGTGRNTPVRLVAAANSLARELAPFIVEIAQDIERQYGLEGLAKEVAESQDMWFVRFLHYFGDRNPGDEIATSHADKCGFTLHLYEDAPGLQFLDFAKQWQDVPIAHDETFVIPGMRMQYRSHNKLKALFHRVVATQTTATTGRFSMVCFVHLKKTPAYDKAKSGRLQEFPPGFNYDMPFEDFSELFRPV